METYIAFLRGINVSGKNIIKMNNLVKMFENLGFEDVKTYVQSGNVVFRFKNDSVEKLQQNIQNRILTDLGFEVPVLVLTFEQLQNIAAENPFASRAGNDISFLHVTFLAGFSKNFEEETIQQKKAKNEEFAITEKAVYLVCSNGYGHTKLNNNFLENKLGVNATTRNWKTTVALLEMANSFSKM